jgi:hypothetical protein
VTLVIAILAGGAQGIRFPIEFDISDSPFILLALICTLYSVPFFRPRSIRGDADVGLSEVAFTNAGEPTKPYM